MQVIMQVIRGLSWNYLNIYDKIKVLGHIPNGLELEKSGFQLQN